MIFSNKAEQDVVSPVSSIAPHFGNFSFAGIHRSVFVIKTESSLQFKLKLQIYKNGSCRNDHILSSRWQQSSYQSIKWFWRCADFNLVQAMAPIWRQWFTGDSGLSLLTIPAVSALGGSTCGDPLLNLASSTLFPDTIKYILTASVIHMYVVYSGSVYILVICCVVHFDRKGL